MSAGRLKRLERLEASKPAEYVVVDLAPWKAAVIAHIEAHRARRPYSMVRRDRPVVLGPAATRLMAQSDQIAKNLERDGVKG
jgi:hypothetical protein